MYYVGPDLPDSWDDAAVDHDDYRLATDGRYWPAASLPAGATPIGGTT